MSLGIPTPRRRRAGEPQPVAQAARSQGTRTIRPVMRWLPITGAEHDDAAILAVTFDRRAGSINAHAVHNT